MAIGLWDVLNDIKWLWGLPHWNKEVQPSWCWIRHSMGEKCFGRWCLDMGLEWRNGSSNHSKPVPKQCQSANPNKFCHGVGRGQTIKQLWSNKKKWRWKLVVKWGFSSYNSGSNSWIGLPWCKERSFNSAVKKWGLGLRARLYPTPNTRQGGTHQLCLLVYDP